MGADTGIRLLTLDDVEELTTLEIANREHLLPWDPTRPADFYTPEGQRTRLDGAAVPAHQRRMARLPDVPADQSRHRLRITGVRSAGRRSIAPTAPG